MNWIRNTTTKRSQSKSEINKQQEFFEKQRLSKLHNPTKPVKRKQHGTSQDLLKLVCISQVARQIESDSSGDESDADWIQSHRLPKVAKLSDDKRKRFIDPEPRMDVKDGRSLFRETLRPSYHSTPFQQSAIGYGLSGQVVGPTVDYTDRDIANWHLSQHNLSPINVCKQSSTLKKEDWSAEYQDIVPRDQHRGYSSKTAREETNVLFSDGNDCLFLPRNERRSSRKESRSLILDGLIAGDSYEEEQNMVPDIRSLLVEERTSVSGHIFERNPLPKPVDADMFSMIRVKDAATSPMLYRTHILGESPAGMFAEMKETTI